MKNKSIKTTAFLLMLAMGIGQITAQNICYTYDAAGNRKSSASCGVQNKLEQGNSTEEAETTPDYIGDFLISPNPTTGQISILSEQGIATKAKVTIVDITGKTVLKGAFGNGEFDLSQAPPGNYILYIEEAGKREKHKMFEKINL